MVGLFLKERAELYGTTTLMDSELLACAAGLEIDTAQRVLDELGGLKGLRNAHNAHTAQLTMLPGIGLGKALQIQAITELAARMLAAGTPPQPVIKSPEDVFQFMGPRLHGLEEEHIYVLLLNTKNRVQSVELIAKGTLDGVAVHPREIYKTAIRNCAAAIIMVHNHPSGDPSPSPGDIQITYRLAEAGRLLGIELLDHVVVGGDTYVSLKQEGMF
ncbi:DNA repair protein RadC [Thermincola ferriacetica]|uniref:DNA repair protein RadC n=1 Tax=Thermincola ferriacetica TaxID=281456 RepID=A0A0L6W3Z4_9FIRM|nr:DNA repair protein RadC [Thermincola ferriacetica]KNZ70302.1 DNA repair protein RadC [Thermincola ferriacetica]